MPGRDTSARRYADAAFELAREADALDAWERDLTTLVEALDNDELREVVEHPAIAYAEKEKVLHRAVPNVGDQPMQLVLLMVRRGRPGAIRPMLERFRELLRRERGITLAEVRTALPLDDGERRAIAERLQKLTGNQVEMHETVDEGLIGGIAVRIGDRLWDASVRGRLERLRARLTAV